MANGQPLILALFVYSNISLVALKVCGCHCYRRAGYLYQYYEAIEQDLEGLLEIVTTQMDTIETTDVGNGLCQDFFELRMVS